MRGRGGEGGEGRERMRGEGVTYEHDIVSLNGSDVLLN